MGGKDKTFFFFDYEARRDAQGVSYLRIVPLAHVRAGGLAYLNNAAGCSATARLDTSPQCITTLTPAQIRALDPLGIGVNHCTTTSQPIEPSPCVEYTGCDAGYPVIWCEHTGGHTVPSFDSAAIGTFFQRF